jgi:hypothetical protein
LAALAVASSSVALGSACTCCKQETSSRRCLVWSKVQQQILAVGRLGCSKQQRGLGQRLHLSQAGRQAAGGAWCEAKVQQQILAVGHLGRSKQQRGLGQCLHLLRAGEKQQEVRGVRQSAAADHGGWAPWLCQAAAWLQAVPSLSVTLPLVTRLTHAV